MNTIKNTFTGTLIDLSVSTKFCFHLVKYAINYHYNNVFIFLQFISCNLIYFNAKLA